MTSEARVEARGYRRYEGERDARLGPARSLALYSLQRALGIRRSAPTKVLPILSVTFAYLPAAAFVGAVALLPRQIRGGIPGYQAYYGFITGAIFLFTALVSPELLCPDRRTGMLGLYLTSPITAWTYLASKVAALTAVLLLVTLGPPLLLIVAFSLQGVGPDGFVELLKTLLRIVGAGVAVAGIYGATALAISSLTDRRAFASAGIVFTIFVPNVVIGVLIAGFDAPRWLNVLTLTTLPFELVQRIYGQRGIAPEIDTAAVVVAWLGLVALGGAVLVLRYAPPRRPKASESE